MNQSGSRQHASDGATRPLRILYSAYACEPGKGSEPGVGWNWARRTAELGHEVWVLTRRNNQTAIEAAQAEKANLRFIYYDLPRRAMWWKRGSRGVHLYYLLWQWFAYLKVKEMNEMQRFDVVHHITFGVLRQPSFMGRLGIPFIVGPLGGGERAPLALRLHYSLRGWLVDALRDVANLVAKCDPLVRSMFSRADLILLKTPESLAWLPARYRHKAHCMLEIGIDPIRANRSNAADGSSRNGPQEQGSPRGSARLELLFVGRFLPLKGMGLGLRALGQLQRSGVRFHLTMIGHGSEMRRWHALADTLGIADQVSWVPWMTQEQLLKAYWQFDLMLFPSLHDSSGNVVLEALSRGLPVVCLGLGGPACLVDHTCGQVVEVRGCGEREVIDRLAAALSAFSLRPEQLAQLREGAILRADAYRWPQVLAQVWGPKGCARGIVAAAWNQGGQGGHPGESIGNAARSEVEARGEVEARPVKAPEVMDDRFGSPPCGF